MACQAKAIITLQDLFPYSTVTAGIIKNTDLSETFSKLGSSHFFSAMLTYMMKSWMYQLHLYGSLLFGVF